MSSAQHQAPDRPDSVCWLADLRKHGPHVARDLHPITAHYAERPDDRRAG